MTTNTAPAATVAAAPSTILHYLPVSLVAVVLLAVTSLAIGGFTLHTLRAMVGGRLQSLA